MDRTIEGDSSIITANLRSHDYLQLERIPLLNGFNITNHSVPPAVPPSLRPSPDTDARDPGAGGINL
jgi:hypothetical protein